MTDATMGQRFRTMRKRADLTLKNVADELGVTISYWSDVERGRRVERRMSRIAAVCDLCGYRRMARAIALDLIHDGSGVIVDHEDWLR